MGVLIGRGSLLEVPWTPLTSLTCNILKKSLCILDSEPLVKGSDRRLIDGLISAERFLVEQV